MSIKFTDIVSQTSNAKVNLSDEDVINIEFKTNFLTPLSILSIRNADDDYQTQVQIMSDALVSWDCVDDKGKMVPITVDKLNLLGIHVLNAIYNAMLEGSRPNPKKANS